MIKANLNAIPNSGKWSGIVKIINDNFALLNQTIESHEVTVKMPHVGTVEEANAICHKYDGQLILVGTVKPIHYYKYNERAGKWVDTGLEFNDASVDLTDFYKKNDIDKQNTEMTTRIDVLEDSVNSLLVSKVSLSMSATPFLIFVGETKEVAVTARVSGGNAESITLGKDGGSSQTVKAQNSATMLDHITGTAGTIASYTATATVYGKVMTATAKVEGVNPIYFGSAGNWDEVVSSGNRQTARKTPNGIYSAEIAAGAKAIFAVPSNMIFEPAKLKDHVEGFGFPVSFVLEEAGYKYYESGTFSKKSKITLRYG